MGALHLRIGEVATRSGLNPRTLRYYEALGVLPSPSREANGYRRYPSETLDLLGFIRQAQGLGFTLEEIKEVLAIRRRGEVPCTHVRALLRQKAVELDRKLADLVALRRRIRRSLTQWGRSRRARATVCPHIEAQSGGGTARKSGRR